MYRLAASAGTLDVNSSYHYLLLCHKFSSTCVVGACGGDLISFLTAFRDPGQLNNLFIWQIAVHAGFRGRGVARGMLEHLLGRDFTPGIEFIETTITPSNQASQKVFRTFAAEHRWELQEKVLFSEDQFPGGNHEPEVLFRIGPLITHAQGKNQL
ncbi:MAG: diaminobutyrate acetyltransferase [Nitrospinaceae bacterium]|jgi:L-2,4-diaminobutyric acid acetyltransferase|nr:MAG: diaminobutyrate acetyltransferase [Nitrospinaceae bacterium]